MCKCHSEMLIKLMIGSSSSHYSTELVSICYGLNCCCCFAVGRDWSCCCDSLLSNAKWQVLQTADIIRFKIYHVTETLNMKNVFSSSKHFKYVFSWALPSMGIR